MHQLSEFQDDQAAFSKNKRVGPGVGIVNLQTDTMVLKAKAIVVYLPPGHLDIVFTTLHVRICVVLVNCLLLSTTSSTFNSGPLAVFLRANTQSQIS